MENQLAKSQGTFLDKAMGDLVQMQTAAQMILDSQLAPTHFYEKGPDGKTDYKKGLVPAVVLVCVHGHDLGMKPLVALQHIIPVNGLLSIKGDAAKSLIFNSGKLKPGTWKEGITGTIEGGDYTCTITAQRSDTLEILSRAFSIAQAKRAGLWVDESKIKGQDGWKWQKSAWWKYPTRMIAYRALGFLARDLFPDVLSGTYTTEEAMDMPIDTEVLIQSPSGAQAVIPDRVFSQHRSDTLIIKANAVIDKRNGKFIASENESSTIPSGKETKDSFSEADLISMSMADLDKIVHDDNDMVTALNVLPGRKSNKKLRTIILAKYNGTLKDLMDENESDPETIVETATSPPLTPMEDGDDPFGEPMTEVIYDEAEEETDDAPVDDPNTFGIIVTDNPGGRRPFDEVKQLYEEFSTVAGLDNTAFVSILSTKLPQFQHYKNLEEFCYSGTKSEINTLLNSI